MDQAADVEPDATVGEFVNDVAGVWHRAGEPVEFRDDQGVAFPAGGEGFAESRSFDSESGKAGPVGCQVLIDGKTRA